MTSRNRTRHPPRQPPHCQTPSPAQIPQSRPLAKQRRPIPSPTALFERNRPMQVWMTRYFKSLDQEEITVSVHPETGRVTGFGHTIPETRPGADIPPKRAREIAAQFAASLGWDTAAMDLKESSAEKKKARRDHSVVWEARPGDPRNVDQTRWRVQV